MFIAKSASAPRVVFASKVLALGFLGFPGSWTFIFTCLFDRTSIPPPLFHRRQPLKIILFIPSFPFLLFPHALHPYFGILSIPFVGKGLSLPPPTLTAPRVGYVPRCIYFIVTVHFFSYRRHARSFSFLHSSPSTHRSRRLINTDSMLFSSTILFRPIVSIIASYRLHISGVVTYCHRKHALCPLYNKKSTLQSYNPVLNMIASRGATLRRKVTPRHRPHVVEWALALAPV